MDIITFIQILHPREPPPESPPLNGSPEPNPPLMVRTAPLPNSASFCLQRKCMVFIFQQNHTLSGCLSCQCRIVNLRCVISSLVLAANAEEHGAATILTASAAAMALLIFLLRFFILCSLLLPVYTFCSMIINFTQFFFDFPCKIIRFTCKFYYASEYTVRLIKTAEVFISSAALLKKLRFKIPARPFLPEMPDSP